MTEKLEIYKCKTCTNVVEVIHQGIGTLVCCNMDMDKLKENIPDEQNPHFAHVEKIDEVTKKVFFNHVMTKEHHIEMIEAISLDDKYIKRKFLKENEDCEMYFRCDCKEGYKIRLYCNIDGVWTTKEQING